MPAETTDTGDLEPEEQLFEDIKEAFGYPGTEDITEPGPQQQARDTIIEISEKLRDAIVAYVESQEDD